LPDIRVNGWWQDCHPSPEQYVDGAFLVVGSNLCRFQIAGIRKLNEVRDTLLAAFRAGTFAEDCGYHIDKIIVVNVNRPNAGMG
jgi:hypothetical protein